MEKRLGAYADVLSGFAYPFITLTSNLITYMLSTSVKVSNTEMAHAPRLIDADH
jgi:hypothetical protein